MRLTPPGVEGRAALRRHCADAALIEAAVRVNAGQAFWRYDPDRDDVVGLVTADDLQRALVVVDLTADDVELSDDFEASL